MYPFSQEYIAGLVNTVPTRPDSGGAVRTRRCHTPSLSPCDSKPSATPAFPAEMPDNLPSNLFISRLEQKPASKSFLSKVMVNHHSHQALGFRQLLSTIEFSLHETDQGRSTDAVHQPIGFHQTLPRPISISLASFDFRTSFGIVLNL